MRFAHTGTSTYILLNKFAIIYIIQQGIKNRQYVVNLTAIRVVVMTKSVIFLHQQGLLLSCTVVLNTKCCILNIFFLHKATNLTTLEGFKIWKLTMVIDYFYDEKSEM